MKYLLEDEYEYDFELFGICCHEKDYRLCWAVNNLLNISLEKSDEQIEVIFNKTSKPNANFPMFKHTVENQLTTYFLIGNRCQNSWLIPEKQHVDYFLMVKSSEKTNNRKLLDELRSIPFILTAHNVVVEQLKSKEHLIF